MHIQLNKTQLDVIRKLIDNNQIMCVVLESSPGDSVADAASLALQLAEMEQMVTDGLFKDYSDTPRFKPLILRSIAEGKRSFKVFGLTETALMLFTEQSTTIH